MRSIAPFLCVAFVSTALVASLPVRAQPAVSDADRAAARELYFAGVQLQQAGKYADALDKLQRAQAVYPAPTHLLHIAECQAALGKLVEASETYRALIRTQLAPNAPAAFQAAQAQGNAELPQVDSRIPDLKLDVSPPNAPGLQVTIDDQPMSSALVGVARPLNPGTHKISVSATGYGRSEQTVTLKERETKAIAVALQPTSTPPVTQLPAPTPGTPSTAQPGSPAARATPPAPPYYPPAPPAPYEQGAPKAVAAQPSSGFMAGLRIGASFPGGKLFQGEQFDASAGTGAAAGIEAGFRFAKTIYLGVNLEGAALSGPSNPARVATAQLATYTSTSSLAAVQLGFITNPHGVGFYGELGVGYRSYEKTKRTESQSNASDFVEEVTTLTGPEFLLGAGIYIKATTALRIIPKAQFGFGSFNSGSVECERGGANATRCDPADSTPIANTGVHTFIFLGVGGYFAHDFK